MIQYSWGGKSRKKPSEQSERGVCMSWDWWHRVISTQRNTHTQTHRHTHTHTHVCTHVHILPAARITITYFAWFREALSYFSPVMDTSVMVGREEEGWKVGEGEGVGASAVSTRNIETSAASVSHFLRKGTLDSSFSCPLLNPKWHRAQVTPLDIPFFQRRTT